MFLRVDSGEENIERIENLTDDFLKSFQAIVISDYNKGFLTEDDIKFICDNHDLVFDLTQGPAAAEKVNNPNKIPPIATNGLNSKELFHQRKYYKEYFLPNAVTEGGGCEVEYGGYRGVSKNLTGDIKTIDLLYEKTFYVRVDHFVTSIYPS